MSLSLAERVSIGISTWRKYRKYIKKSNLPKKVKDSYKNLFWELHKTFYVHTVRTGHNIMTSEVFLLDFLISSAEENVRSLLFAYNEWVRITFYSSLRSQIELMGLIYYFLETDNIDYAKEFMAKNDDRNNSKDVINIITCIEKLSKKHPWYKEQYDILSRLVHPNPSGIHYKNSIDFKDKARVDRDIYFMETWNKKWLPNYSVEKYIDDMLWMVLYFIALIELLKKKGNLLYDSEKKEIDNLKDFRYLINDSWLLKELNRQADEKELNQEEYELYVQENYMKEMLKFINKL